MKIASIQQSQGSHFKLLFLTILILFAQLSMQVTKPKPVIGIFTLPSTFGGQYPSDNYSYFGGGYVQYLESAGAQVIPIKYDYSDAQTEFLLTHINGVLFPGGDPNLWVNETTHTGFSAMTLSAMRIIKWALKQNTQGNFFPIWGTCLGYEMLLMAITEDEHVLDQFDQENQSANLTYVIKREDSNILSYIPENIINYTKSNPAAYFSHKYGKTYTGFQNSPELDAFFKVDAVAYDEKGKEFVALIEGRRYPFYGSQFHPEVQIFQDRPEVDTNHNPNTILFSQFLGRFFVKQSRRSQQSFANFQSYNVWSIYKYYPVISPDDFYDIVYFFNNTNSKKEEFLSQEIKEEQMVIQLHSIEEQRTEAKFLE